MKTLLGTLLLTAMLIGSPTARSHTMGLTPLSGVWVEGSVQQVNLVASSLDSVAPGNIVSAYDVSVTFDSMVLALLQVEFSGALGTGNDFVSSVTSGASTRVVGRSLLSDVDLLARQSQGHATLATFTFRPLTTGDLAIQLDVNSLFGGIEEGSNPPAPKQETDLMVFYPIVQVVVRTVPEPSSIALLGMVLISSGIARWKQSQLCKS